MNMQIDKYTGELYDADEWYRGAFGCWVNKKAEEEHRRRVEDAERKRREKRNAARVAKGKRRRSASSFKRSAERFRRYRESESEMSFGEWLKKEKWLYEGWDYCDR